MPTGVAGSVRPFSRILLGALNPLFDVAHVLEILRQADLVARPQPAIEIGRIVPHRIQDAGVETATGETLSGRARPAEQPLEDHARIGLHRQRHRRRLPRHRVLIGAAVARVAGADVPGDVLDRQTEGAELGIRADLSGDDLIDGRADPDVFGFRALGGRAGQEGRDAARMRAFRRFVGAADHDEMIAERLERLQNRRELEARAGRVRGPLVHHGAHRHEDGAESARRRGGRGQRGGRGDHRIEERQRKRGPDALQESSTRQRHFRDEHSAPSRRLPMNLAQSGVNGRRRDPTPPLPLARASSASGTACS